jgi:hypothetical protein
MSHKIENLTMLNSVSAGGASGNFGVAGSKGWTFVVDTEAAGVATIDIEAEIEGNWFVIHSQDVNALGSFIIRDESGHYKKIRANVSSYTGGTHSVYATGSYDS